MALGLERSWGVGFYKGFLMGHPGVGKSTELTRLVERVSRPIPGDPIPGDERARPGELQAVRRPAPDDDQGRRGDRAAGERRGCWREPRRKRLLQEVRLVRQGGGNLTESRETGIEGSARDRPIGTSLSGRRCSASSPTSRVRSSTPPTGSKKIVEYRLERLSALIELVNKLLNECNDLLRKATGLRMAVHRGGIRSGPRSGPASSRISS